VIWGPGRDPLLQWDGANVLGGDLRHRAGQRPARPASQAVLKSSGWASRAGDHLRQEEEAIMRGESTTAPRRAWARGG